MISIEYMTSIPGATSTEITKGGNQIGIPGGRLKGRSGPVEQTRESIQRGSPPCVNSRMDGIGGSVRTSKNLGEFLEPPRRIKNPWKTGLQLLQSRKNSRETC